MAESKDLRTDFTANVYKMRRFFDFAQNDKSRHGSF